MMKEDSLLIEKPVEQPLIKIKDKRIILVFISIAFSIFLLIAYSSSNSETRNNQKHNSKLFVKIIRESSSGSDTTNEPSNKV